MLRRYAKTLIAILGGNFLYYVVLYPYLPRSARHRLYQLDWGLAVDFWLCVACYGLISLFVKTKSD
jgi:hypothetical protein